MAFDYNENIPKKITYNSNNVKRLVYNDVLVWTAATPFYWFEAVTDDAGTVIFNYTDDYPKTWAMSQTCCDDLTYGNTLHSLECSCDEHEAWFKGTASGSAKGCTYADINVVRLGGQEGGYLTANGVDIFSVGVHTVPITNDTLTLGIGYGGGGGETAINYIYFHD